MAIVRLYDGSDGQSHFEEITPRFEPRGDQSEIPELIPGTGILMRRFETKRENPGITHRADMPCSPCRGPWISRSVTAACAASGPATC